MEAATLKKREWGAVGGREGGREMPLREMAENGTKMTEACSVGYTSTTEYFLQSWKTAVLHIATWSKTLSGAFR